MMLLILFLICGDGILPCLVCCGLHECGHLLVCLLLKLQFSALNFTVTGLNLRLKEDLQSLPIAKAILLHGGGILMNLICACIFGMFGMQLWTWVNLSLAAFHLIPASELDGGRIWLLLGQKLLQAQWLFFYEWIGQVIAFLIFAWLAFMALKIGETGFGYMTALIAVSRILPGNQK